MRSAGVRSTRAGSRSCRAIRVAWSAAVPAASKRTPRPEEGRRIGQPRSSHPRSGAAHRGRAMHGQVVAHDAPAIGPARQHRPLQLQRRDDRRDIVRPGLRRLVEGVALGLGRCRHGRAGRRSPCGSAAASAGSVTWRAHDRCDCQDPWMNRMAGPCGLPHSCTDSTTPSGLVTVWGRYGRAGAWAWACANANPGN